MKLAESFESGTLIESAMSGRSDAWVTRSPAAEARDLYRMVRYGDCTIASIRDLISVPPHVEAVLLAYVRSHPEDAGRIKRVLRFREQVRREFDQLVAPSASDVVPELLTQRDAYAIYGGASADVAR